MTGPSMQSPTQPPPRVNGWDIRVLAPLLLVAVVGLGYGLTLCEGVGWSGGDWATYIWNAQNILNGREIGAAPFIPNYNADTGVTVVPPLFPLALTAPVALFGPDLEVLKVYNILLLLVFFLLAYSFAYPSLRSGSLAFLVALAASPLLWGLRETIMSEYLFLLIAMALLISWEKLYIKSPTASAGTRWLLTILVATLGAALPLTRTVGLVALPALLLAGLWTERRLSPRTAAIALATFAAIVYLFAVIGITEQYGPSFSQAALSDLNGQEAPAAPSPGIVRAVLETLPLVPARIRDSIGQTSVMWTSGVRPGSPLLFGWAHDYQRLVTASILLLAMIGFVARSMRQVTLAEWFTLGYGSMMLLAPAYLASGRMFLPVAVLLVFYAFVGARLLGQRLPGRLPGAISIGLLGLILVSEALSFAARGTGCSTTGSADPRAKEFFEAVRLSVPEDAVVIGYRPRGVAFFTGRTATDYHQNSADADFWNRAQSLHADYMYFDLADPEIGGENDTAWRPETMGRYVDRFVDGSRERFDLIFENERFRLYGLRQ